MFGGKGIAPIVDPYIITSGAGGPRFTDTGGRTRVSPVLTGGEKVIITLGQSNIGNWVGDYGDTPYVPSNTLVQNFNISDGGVYQAVDRMLGSDGPAGPPDFGSISIRIADQLRSAGIGRVIMAPMAMGGTAASQWAVGGTYNADIPVMVKRLRAVGLEPTHICRAQGEADGPAGTTTANYLAYLTSEINTFRALGVNCPYLVGKSDYNTGVTYPAIQAAYAAAIATLPNVFAGADTNTLTGATYRIADLHFTKAGGDAAAVLWKNAILAH